MREKLLIFSLVSFGSFCFFTFLFHTMAKAQTGMFTAAAPLPGPTTAAIARIQSTPTVPPSLAPTYSPSKKPTAIPTSLPVGNANPTATPTIKLQPTTLPTPTTITPTITPTLAPTALPQPTTPVINDLETVFTKYSDEYHVDKELLKTIARCESGFNPNAENGPYIGMYQFAEQTWVNTRQKMGVDSNPELRRNGEESIRTAAYMIANGQQNAWAGCL